MSLFSKIESILFVASQPLSLKKISKGVGKSIGDVEQTLENLMLKYNTEDSGINILHENEMYQMSSSPTNVDIVEGFVKDEIAGELTRAQLETLTVVAYRGPVTRPELEQIRGVNCAVILRNLLIRGLIMENQEKNDLVSNYSLSLEALRHLGVKNSSELPEYEGLHAHEHISHILDSDE